MDLSKLFDLKYLVDNNPPADTYMVLPIATFFVVLVLIGLILQLSIELHFVSPVWRGLVRKVPGNFYIFAIFGLLLVFARYEGSPFLSMRLLLLLLILGLIGYIVYKAIYIYRELPRRLRSQRK